MHTFDHLHVFLVIYQALTQQNSMDDSLLSLSDQIEWFRG
jgi:hypothetical protein